MLTVAFAEGTLKRLGEGATSVVYGGRLDDGRRAVLKVAKSRSDVGVFAAEAERLAWLSTPGLPELIDAGWVSDESHGSLPALVLSWVPGQPLAKAWGRGVDELALIVAREVGETLASMERVGISHGDIKPANVLVHASRSSVGLIDLGLGGDCLEPISGGTPRYLPRDLAMTTKRVLADRYAFGVVLAEILCEDAREDDDPAGVFLRRAPQHPLSELVRALLTAPEGARPSAAMVASRAARELGDRASRAEAHAVAWVRAAYVSVRRASLENALAAGRVEVEPSCASWAESTVVRVRSARSLLSFAPRSIDDSTIDDAPPATLASQSRVTKSAIAPLDDEGRLRWIASLVGPAAASWSLGAISSVRESDLERALVTLATQRHPRSWAWADIESVALHQRIAPPSEKRDLLTLALELARRPVPEQALSEIESEIEQRRAPEPIHASWLDVVRRQGDPVRALLSVPDDRLDSLGARTIVAAAEAARRTGALDRAMDLCLRVMRASTTTERSAIARARAILARIWLDRGEPQRALSVLDEAEAAREAGEDEVRSLALLALGDHEGARTAALRGVAISTDDEGRARLTGVLGFVAHAAGQPEMSLASFREAAALAARAGAVVEEAAYRTGEAAAAVDHGAIECAIDASSRAVALWESLGRHADAARACLSRAAALRVVGSLGDAIVAAEDARYLARRAHDLRAERYAFLVLADAREGEHSNDDARALRALFATLDLDAKSGRNNVSDDLVRVAARLLRRDAFDPDRIADLDAIAADATAVAVLEWWEVRLRKFLASPTSTNAPLGRLPDLLASLVGATARDAPIDARGAALDAARRLAMHLGDTTSARRCRSLQAALASRLVHGCPPSMRANVQRVVWVDAVSGVPEAPALHVDQIVDVVSLVRSLTTRDHLRPLLEQILDALISWTRVERGVLLLRAPNGRLVPRVARNIRRVDLHGEQLKLSTSLAHKAADERRTVVAVDAAGEAIDARASVHLLQLRSVLAVPLIAGGEVLGVAYLDDRSRRGAFGPQEIAWVDLVAGIAALAVADTRDQLLLRRAVRRAERASEHLAVTLETRTIERDSLAAVVQPALTSAGRARFSEIIGTSPSLSDALRLAERVARTDVPVLISGESGSGKELFARAVHRNGSRGTRPFVSENCGAVTETLLESTLFGHVKGAFTGASDRRIGLFELAHRGTLFLDEIGEMSLAMQTKLLRILVDGDVRAVGASVSKHVDVRVIAATHRDLKKMVREGSFREDLYYRLCVVELHVPPLRERIDDIPLLIKHMLSLHAADRRVRVSPQAMNLLVAYSWPGNIRQLENEVRRALILADDLIEPTHLSNDITASSRGTSRAPESESLVLRERVDELERQLIGTALRRTRGNQSKASTLLGVSRFGLQKMMKRLDIEIETVAIHPGARSSEP